MFTLGVENGDLVGGGMVYRGLGVGIEGAGLDFGDGGGDCLLMVWLCDGCSAF